MHDRENRKKNTFDFGSAKYFRKIETLWKVKYADINKDNLDSLFRIKKKLRLQLLKACLKFDFNQIELLKNKIIILSKIIPQIQKSKLINKNKRVSYL